MNVSVDPDVVAFDRETTDLPLQSLQDRYILTQVGNRQLAFPSPLVAELLLIERSQILALPFYDPIIVGVVHYHGQIVPLVALQNLFDKATGFTKETVDVIQLSQDAGRLAGIGIIVDRIVENRSRDQLPEDLFNDAVSPTAPATQDTIQLFRTDLLGDRIWIPQRWTSSQNSQLPGALR